MFGNNPKRKPVKSDGKHLEVQEIFATVQGEGPNTGVPAVFIRLGGCNLACAFCDTEFESFETESIETIMEEVTHLSEDGRQLVVITGGEPLRQPISLLCEQLIEQGYNVQIETNGTLYRDLPDDVEIICSPKANSKGHFAVDPRMLERIDAFKYVIAKEVEFYQTLPAIKDNDPEIPVYLQPMDEGDKAKNEANLAYCIAMSQELNSKLSIQTHKVIGLP